jgi:hypothetical protein
VSSFTSFAHLQAGPLSHNALTPPGRTPRSALHTSIARLLIS